MTIRQSSLTREAATAEKSRLITPSHRSTHGDRAVLGEEPVGAAIAFGGEQPGDQEEREGRPFDGPDGPVAGQGTGRAGIDRRCRWRTFLATPPSTRRTCYTCLTSALAAHAAAAA